MELGRKLYFEKKLSRNESQSCNTCHDIEGGKAGVDNQPTSGGAFGKRVCHYGPTWGGLVYHKAGLIKPYENTEDLGRYVVTKDEDDKFKFKVPSLRNVALTGPYFHDGRIQTLDLAVVKMADMQLGRQPTAEETALLTAFLNSLSDRKLAAGQK